MTRILVVDDSEALRRAVRPLIEGAFPGAVIGEAAGASAGLAAAAEARWDVVLLDLSLRGAGGMDVLRELRRRLPALPVVVMSLHAEADYGPAARAAGAVGYVDKADLARALAPAITRALGASPSPATPPPPQAPADWGDQRQRLARALHDDIGQALIAAKLELQLGEGEPEAAARGRAAAARAILDGAVARLRALSAELGPERLAGQGS